MIPPLTETVSLAHRDPHDMIATVKRLREQVSGGDGVDLVLETLNELDQKLEFVLDEHGGMAEELLCVYEQLGIVFEMTASLPGVEEENEVVNLFINSLGNTFKETQVVLARQKPNGEWKLCETDVQLTDWLAKLIEQSKDTKQVLAERPIDNDMPSWVKQVLVGPIYSVGDFVCSVVLLRREQEREFRASDMLLVESISLFCSDLIRNQHLLTELKETSLAMVRALVSAIDQKDPYTSGHSLRVGYFAMLLAREVGVSNEQLQMLRWAALIHDIGKIGIRDDVLKKPGKLTSQERLHIMEHPRRSYEIIKEVSKLNGAIDGVLHHHEKFDGTGYPDGLKGKDIPLQARIITVADIFDALTSTRSYRKAFGWEKALVILEEESGTTVDPEIRATFDAMIKRMLGEGGISWEQLVTYAEHFTRLEQIDIQMELTEAS